MQHAAHAYGATAKQTGNPREMKADLLLNAAAQLQAIRNGWDGRRAAERRQSRPETLAPLIAINRELAAGLIGRP